MNVDADLAMFLNTADFAEVAMLGATEIVGIFDNGFAAALDVAGSVPTFTCRSADAEKFNPGTSILVIRSSSWLVIGVEDDGTGMAVARLQMES